jgi:conjugative relaxase-like TrwC/TraI family protein
VLGVRRLTAQGIDYYLDDLAQELPSATDARVDWVGQASEGLGLQGPIEPAHLRAVLQGRHPTTGSRLRSDRASVPGLDLTFTAPKSVSLLFALAGDEATHQVLAAHRAGVGGALSYMERHGLAARRGSGEGREIVPSTGLVGAAFTHGVNRNLDPHLHTHVIVANVVHGVDGQWSACDQRGLSAHRGAASAVYDAHLRAELSERMGVEWTGGPWGRAEVSGVSPLLLGEFSSRSADIRRHMSTWGSHSARGARVAWAATRPDKQANLNRAQLSEQWLRRARSLGGGAGEVEVLPTSIAALPGIRYLHEHRFHGMLALTPDGAARRRDVVAAFGAAAVGGARTDALESLTDMWIPANAAKAEIGVAERSHPLRSVVPGPHLLRELGPRPVDPSLHHVWREAALAIEEYRGRWGVTSGAASLSDVVLSAFPTERLIDHLRIARQADVARQRLGARSAQSIALDRGR